MRIIRIGSLAGIILLVFLAAAAVTSADDTQNPIAGINLDQLKDKDNVISGDEITYMVTIHNIGNVDLTDLTMITELDNGMEFLTAEPQMPENKNDAKLKWILGTLSTNDQKKLNYTIKINGSGIGDGTSLNNNIIVSSRDNNNNWLNNSSNSVLWYEKVSGKNIINGRMVIRDKKSKTSPEREPLVRNTIHLGRALIWDRHAYGGWMEPRKPDPTTYFIFNIEDIDKTKPRIWYTP